MPSTGTVPPWRTNENQIAVRNYLQQLHYTENTAVCIRQQPTLMQ